MTLPDNRIRFTPTKIDFANDVGLTGQDHDSYPPPQGLARYDHMRMCVIGLLSQQSSYDPPTQKREGTPWFDLNDLSLKIYSNGSWVSYSDAIKLSSVSLTEWSQSVETALLGIYPDLVFFAKCTVSGIDQITIPSAIQSKIGTNTKVFITVTNSAGSSAIVDPREVQLIGTPFPTTIYLTSFELEAQDELQIILRRVPDDTFITATVEVP